MTSRKRSSLLQTARFFLAVAILAVLDVGNALAITINYSSFSFPGAYVTFPEGISGDLVTGYYLETGEPEGSFVYNMATQQIMALPNLGGQTFVPEGISGSTIAGQSPILPASYTYNLQSGTYTELQPPGGVYFQAEGISGSNVVGYVGNKGEVYYNSVWSSLNYPGSTATFVDGINGDQLVGRYGAVGPDGYGFVYNEATGVWQSFIDPNAVQGANSPPMDIRGISGQYMVGEYAAGSNLISGFLYDAGDWISIPGQTTSIDGNYFVGYSPQGAYVAEIVPEPPTLSILLIGGAVLCAALLKRQARGHRLSCGTLLRGGIRENSGNTIRNSEPSRGIAVA